MLTWCWRLDNADIMVGLDNARIMVLGLDNAHIMVLGLDNAHIMVLEIRQCSHYDAGY